MDFIVHWVIDRSSTTNPAEAQLHYKFPQPAAHGMKRAFGSTNECLVILNRECCSQYIPCKRPENRYLIVI